MNSPRKWPDWKRPKPSTVDNRIPMIAPFLRQLGRVLITLLLVGAMSAQAAYQCQTPPVTEAFVREMDSRIGIIRQALEKAGCSERVKVTLLGFSFYPDPVPAGTENPQLTGEIFSTGYRYLTQSMATSYNEAFGLREFFLSIAGTQDSYQLQLDSTLVQDRFAVLRDLMGMTQQACAQDATLEGASLASYAESWYFTYRQLYFWLLLAKSPVLTEEEQTLSRSLADNSQVVRQLGALYSSLFAKRLEEKSAPWYPAHVSCALAPTAAATKARTPSELGQNFFACNVFYTPEYANALMSTCQSPELGGVTLDGEVNRLMESINRVGPAFEEIGEASQELGAAGRARWEDMVEMWGTGDLSSFVRLNTNLDRAAMALRTNLAEWLAPAEYASSAERYVEKMKEPLSDRGEPVQAKGLTGSVSGTIAGNVGDAIREEQKVALERDAAYDAAHEQVADTMNIRREYLRSLEILNTKDFTEVTRQAKEGADKASSLCMRASPGAGQEYLCGVR